MLYLWAVSEVLRQAKASGAVRELLRFLGGMICGLGFGAALGAGPVSAVFMWRVWVECEPKLAETAKGLRWPGELVREERQARLMGRGAMELIAAAPPHGSGSELEPAQHPEGRGSEITAGWMG